MCTAIVLLINLLYRDVPVAVVVVLPSNFLLFLWQKPLVKQVRIIAAGFTKKTNLEGFSCKLF